ncbi:DUF4034 domain-containing protein [Saccharothrix variisporea]|uniref:DUF4034 domain-containing protein n=1 Tax=Saccharothrix variisporea TaxID=543527 RepID=A0A495X102_9PSEU|nr:DUF4034 domain-containing protein [Saccharothrix variisporea]RKT66894.1 hypothetical protein DFJ66_0059 [Saccharothrix variisporea]
MVVKLLLNPFKTARAVSLLREASRRGVDVDDLPSHVVVDKLFGRVDYAQWGLAAPEDVTTDVPVGGPELTRARAAAAEGRWEPAAELLASTWQDWDLRAEVVDELATLAAHDDTWLQRWSQAQPDSRDLAVVHAHALVHVAWQARGTAGADQTSRQQFQDFHRLLLQAQAAARATAAAVPEDPTPWVTLVMLARGLSYDHEQFGQVWDELVARAPLHRMGHGQALQYWCKKWHGSHELMCDFATRAAAASPSLAALPLRAAYEMMRDKPDAFRSPMTREALDTLLPWLASVGADTLWLRNDRGWAIYTLAEHKRHAEAVDQFRVLGARADGAPWSLFPKPLELFLQLRLESCKAAGKP